MLLLTNLLIETKPRSPGEITQSLPPIESKRDPGGGVRVSLQGVGGGEGSQPQPVLIAVGEIFSLVLTEEISSGRADLT